MSKVMEKYVAKALEGYEQNHTAISAAITQLEEQLKDYKDKQKEMEESITEMKDVLGLADEEAVGGNAKASILNIVKDGAPVDME